MRQIDYRVKISSVGYIREVFSLSDEIYKLDLVTAPTMLRRGMEFA